MGIKLRNRMIPNISLKKLKEMHQRNGGNANNYFLISYSKYDNHQQHGRCITTNKPVEETYAIAFNYTSKRDTNIYLVVGHYSNRD